MTRALLAAIFLVPALPAQDANEIIARSAAQYQDAAERLRDYTFLRHAVQISYNKQGQVTKRESETHEILILAGRPYERLVARDGEPLSQKDARKEQEKADKELARRLKNPEKQRKEAEKDREEARRYIAEIPRAFFFTLLGEETLEGRPVWKLRAEPRPDFKPRVDDAKVFKKVRGTLWIDQQTYQAVKVDMEVIDTISWGLFLVRVPPGATMSFTQTVVNNEIWAPARVDLRADARLGLMKTFRLGFEMTFSNYRKFSAESQVVGVEELQQE
jgi:hypothetical protein